MELGFVNGSTFTFVYSLWLLSFNNYLQDRTQFLTWSYTIRLISRQSLVKQWTVIDHDWILDLVLCYCWSMYVQMFVIYGEKSSPDCSSRQCVSICTNRNTSDIFEKIILSCFPKRRKLPSCYDCSCTSRFWMFKAHHSTGSM